MHGHHATGLLGEPPGERDPIALHDQVDVGRDAAEHEIAHEAPDGMDRRAHALADLPGGAEQPQSRLVLSRLQVIEPGGERHPRSVDAGAIALDHAHDAPALAHEDHGRA